MHEIISLLLIIPGVLCNIVEFNKNFDKEIPIDLKQSSMNELKFLSLINDETFYNGTILKNAIRRYEQNWLPMQAASPDVKRIPPLDVYVIWHSHMLNPIAYRKDSFNLVGVVVDHEVFKPDDFFDQNLQKQSAEDWKKYNPAESYEFQTSQKTIEYQQKSHYDLLSAPQRQRKFAQRMLLPENSMTNEDFNEAVNDYKKFLFLAQQKEDIVPTLEIDLIWHTHMLNPNAYYENCLELLGFIFGHDDSEEINRNEGWNNTKELWEKHGLDDGNAHKYAKRQIIYCGAEANFWRNLGFGRRKRSAAKHSYKAINT